MEQVVSNTASLEIAVASMNILGNDFVNLRSMNVDYTHESTILKTIGNHGEKICAGIFFSG